MRLFPLARTQAELESGCKIDRKSRRRRRIPGENADIRINHADGVRWNPPEIRGFFRATATDHGAPRALKRRGPWPGSLACDKRRISMRRACTIAAMIWISGAAAAYAQTTTTSGMGATSPLGAPASEPSSGASTGNIPLGATELAQPGTSPLQMPCPNTSSNTSFDGGGMSTSTGCSPAGTSSASGTASATPGSSGANAASMDQSTAGSGIPLGATGLGTPGESQNIPVPNLSAAPCAQTQGASNSTNSTAVVSSGGC